MRGLPKDGAFVRSRRIDSIAKELEYRLRQNEMRYRYKKFVAEMAIKHGLKRATIREYIDLLVEAESFKILGDEIVEWFDVSSFMPDTGDKDELNKVE